MAGQAPSTGNRQRSTADPSAGPSLSRIVVLDNMLGWTGKHSRSQGEQVAELLVGDGIEVRAGSRRPGRAVRLFDMLWLVLRSCRWAQAVIISVYSGPGFRLADLASRIAARCGIPVVLVLHGGELPVYAGKHPERVRALLTRADAVIAPSSFNADRLAAYDDKPIHIIPNVVDVDLDAWRARTELRPTIFWMRALHPIYGPEIAVATMAKVAAARPDARMTMAGPDKADLAAEITARITELGLEERIELLGFLDRDAKRRLFAEHDLYLNTSRADNTPVALLEAAANGLVVVSTDAGGIPELFDNDRTAALHPIDDAEALAGSILRLLDDQEQAAAMAVEARDLARSMSWPALRPQWAAVLDAASARHR